MKTIYTIPAPDSLGAMIEVYGEPENAWYEWRIIDGDTPTDAASLEAGYAAKAKAEAARQGAGTPGSA